MLLTSPRESDSEVVRLNTASVHTGSAPQWFSLPWRGLHCILVRGLVTNINRKYNSIIDNSDRVIVLLSVFMLSIYVTTLLLIIEMGTNNNHDSNNNNNSHNNMTLNSEIILYIVVSTI